MRRLTEAELREPDVWLAMPLERWHNLPTALQNELRPHMHCDKITKLIFRLPAYRWRDIQSIAHCEPGN